MFDFRRQLAHSGTCILWHDFHPGLTRNYAWIDAVCRGVDRLCADGDIRGPILHLTDSWTGLYRVP